MLILLQEPDPSNSNKPSQSKVTMQLLVLFLLPILTQYYLLEDRHPFANTIFKYYIIAVGLAFAIHDIMRVWAPNQSDENQELVWKHRSLIDELLFFLGTLYKLPPELIAMIFGYCVDIGPDNRSPVFIAIMRKSRKHHSLYLEATRILRRVNWFNLNAITAPNLQEISDHAIRSITKFAIE